MGRKETLVLTVAGVLASLVLIKGYQGEQARAEGGVGPEAGGAEDVLKALEEQQERLRTQQEALADQAQRLEAQRGELAAQQEQLRSLRAQLDGGRERSADARPRAQTTPVGLPMHAPLGGAAAIAPEEADRMRGFGAGAAGTLQVRPPQQFFGRMRGEVVPVPPEGLEEVSPEPPLPVRVPDERREEFLQLREQMRRLLLPEPKPDTETEAVEVEEEPEEEAPAEARPPVTAAVPPEQQRGAPPGATAPPAPAAVPPEAVQRQRQQEVGPQVAALEDRTQRPEVVAEVLAQSVLTPAGVLSVEPSLEYVHSSNNRFIFQGVEIVDAVLVGAIEASDADRDIVTSAVTLRYGLTDRIEVDAKVPGVYRDDRINTQLVGDTGEATTEQSFDGYGLGDVEFGAHYQITGQAPFLIGNVRVKAPTGEGPFDVDRGADGVETEAPTGSGFWSIEPSITAIYPSEPAVFFGNIGYLWNMERDVDTQVGDNFIGNVDPGDSISGSLGMGFALNERASMSFGYEHNFILETETEITDDDDVTRTSEADTLQVGNFFIGGSYRLSDRVTLNSTVQIGATEDAPDVQVTLRVPIRFDLSQLFGS